MSKLFIITDGFHRNLWIWPKFTELVAMKLTILDTVFRFDFRLALVLYFKKWLLLFAYDTTAMLSWHVPQFVVIWCMIIFENTSRNGDTFISTSIIALLLNFHWQQYIQFILSIFNTTMTINKTIDKTWSWSCRCPGLDRNNTNLDVIVEVQKKLVMALLYNLKAEIYMKLNWLYDKNTWGADHKTVVPPVCHSSMELPQSCTKPSKRYSRKDGLLN